jgi:hypothetical protein
MKKPQNILRLFVPASPMPRGRRAVRQALCTRIDDWSIENKGQTFKTEIQNSFL